MDEPVRPDPAPRSDEPAPSSPETQIPDDAPPDEVEAPDVEPAPPLAQPAGPPPRPPGRRIAPPSPRVALTIAGAGVLLGVFYLGRSAVGPFVVGLVLAYLLDPPVERMARIGIPRWISVLLVYAVVVIVGVQALIVTLRPLGDELATFIREFPTFTAQVADIYAHLDLPPALRNAVDGWLATLGEGVGGLNPADLLPVVGGIAGIVGSIVGYIIIPVWVFYLIKDRPALSAAAERSMPAEWRPDFRAVSGLILRVFGQWLRGQVFLGITVGAATFVGLLLLSQTVDPVFGRFAILLSVVAGILELLPIIGPIIAAIPAVLLALTGGIDAAIAAVVLYTVIQQIENNLLVPKIQGDAVELHPSAVMIALVMGGAIAGLLGAILALPITAAARDVFRYLFHRLDEPPTSPAEAVAILRARPIVVTEPPDAAGAGAGA
ncbi:MAG TPA: AI-2E family transporter [Candidatus Limnocylindrales bacterium]|jgi:predicted PurR-regulated permease PerM|nr:AI-2E family transporter [Candidatus Limnocylindrales bacterium]